MSEIAERSQGAVTFTSQRQMTSGASRATVFSNQAADEWIDDAWDNAIDELRSFRGLKDDWDGEGSLAPPHDLIEMAIGLAARFRDISHPAPLRCVAGVNGTISFELGGEPFTEIEIVSATVGEMYEAGVRIGIFRAD